MIPFKPGRCGTLEDDISELGKHNFWVQISIILGSILWITRIIFGEWEMPHVITMSDNDMIPMHH